MTLRRSLLAITLLAGLALAGCTGGGDDLADALAALTGDDLAIMVLPLEDYGPDYAGFDVSSDGGANDAAANAEDTFDPDDTAAELEEAGWESGYELGFEDPDALDTLEAGEGAIAVSTSVELLSDEAAATAYMEKQFDDMVALQGEELDAGSSLEEATTFEVDGLGDEAQGARTRLSVLGAQEFTGTFVVFRIDRLIGVAIIVRADDGDINTEVEDLAAKLEHRVRGVLGGDITGTPIPIPTEDQDEPATVEPPEDIPDLSSMALAASDVSPDTSVEREGYIEADDTVATYEREFDTGSEAIGAGTTLLSLETDVELYESISQAQLGVSAFDFIFQGNGGEQLIESLFAEGFEEEAGFEADNIETSELPDFEAGDQVSGFQAAFDSPIGRVEVVLIVVRVGEAVGLMTAVGTDEQFDISDVTPLAVTLGQRMRSELEDH
jgi:hypothetical protein